MLFNLTAFIISVFLIILLCVIVQKNIVSEIAPAVIKTKDGEYVNKQNNPYGDQYDPNDPKSKEEIIKNLQYVTDCPDYWTPYYNNNTNEFICVSDNPEYNVKMRETLEIAAKSTGRGSITKVKMPLTPESMDLKQLTSSMINNMNVSPLVSQNKHIYIIDNSDRFISRGNSLGSMTSGWDAKCTFTENTCIPWTGVNSSHTRRQKSSDGTLKTCLNSKCLQLNTHIPAKHSAIGKGGHEVESVKLFGKSYPWEDR